MCGPVACGGKHGVLLAIDADGWMDGGDVGRRAWGCKKKKRFTYTDGWMVCVRTCCVWWKTWCIRGADGWMVVVLAVEPGDVKKKKKKKFYLHGWVVVDACGWWSFRRMVAVVAVYTADVEEEKKKEKKRKGRLTGGCWRCHALNWFSAVNMDKDS